MVLNGILLLYYKSHALRTGRYNRYVRSIGYELRVATLIPRSAKAVHFTPLYYINLNVCAEDSRQSSPSRMV